MLETLKKTFLAGLGATVVTAERLEKSLSEFVERGKISSEEAREMARKMAEEGRREYDEARECMEGWFEEMVGKAGLVRKTRLEEMEARLRELEAKVAGASAADPESAKTTGA